MSASSLNLAVWVRLKDRFSGKMRSIVRGINRLGSAARKLGAVAGIVGGLTFAGPAQSAAEFNQSLLDNAVTAGIARTEVNAWIARNRAAFEDLALATGQFSADIAKTAGELKAANLGDALIKQILPAISRTATAASADISDIAKVAIALNQNLEVTANQMEDALGKLVVAGKEGRFELKEMAKFFPSLTSLMANFGVKGQEAVSFLASGLQVAIIGASDPAQAANNFKNFLQKITATDTIKRFKDAGVDIIAVMQDAAKRGINPIEAVIAKTQDLTGVSTKVIAKMMAEAKANGIEGAAALKVVEDQLKKIGAAGTLAELFGDQQVKALLLPFLANIDKFKRIKKATDEAGRKDIGTGFDIQLDGQAAQLRTFRELGVQAAREIGTAFNKWLPRINEQLKTFRDYMDDLEKKFPGVKEQLLGWGTGGVLAAAGLGVLGLVLPVVITGAELVASAFGALGLALPIIIKGMKLLKLAFLAALTPMGFAITVLVFGAYWIIKNWDKIVPFFKLLWANLKAGWNTAVEILDAAIEKIIAKVDAMVEWFKGLPDRITAALSTMWDVLSDTLNGAIETVKTDILGLVEWFKGLPGRIIAAIGKIDLSGLITLPSIFGSDAKPAGANDNRPVRRGNGTRVPVTTRSAVQVGGQITVKVDGPGRVTSTRSANSNVPINSGRMVGRP